MALLLMLCNVPAQAIADEYALTDKGLAHLHPLFIERLLKNPALAGNEQGVRNMISSKSENMSATIELIDQKFGGAEGYLLDTVGLSKEQVAQLKKNLTVDAAPLFKA